MLGMQELIIAGVVLVVLVFAPILFAFTKAGFRHPLLTAIPVSIALFLVVALVAGSTGVNGLGILVIIAIAAIVYGLLAPDALSTQQKETVGHDTMPVSFHAESETSDAELSKHSPDSFKAPRKRSETPRVAAFFAFVGFLMLLGVLYLEIITPKRPGEYQFDVNNGGSVEWEELDITTLDAREQAIINSRKKYEDKSILDMYSIAFAKAQVMARRQQRSYAEQTPPEVVDPVQEMLSSLGARDKVIGIISKLTPKQREEVLRLAPGVAQQLGDDRGGAVARCFAAVSWGLTYRLVNPLMELFGIGGTPEDIGFIRQIDEMALQEFHPYRPGDPWYERIPLQAIEMLPLAFLIGALVFSAYHWKAQSATQSSTASTLQSTHSESSSSDDAELESLRKKNEELKRKVEARKLAEKQAEDKAALEAENARMMAELGEEMEVKSEATDLGKIRP
jgi:hypothetical protein